MDKKAIKEAKKPFCNFNNILNQLKETPDSEKKDFLASAFNSSFNPDKVVFNGYKLEDSPDYIKIKACLFPFLDFLESKGLDLAKIFYVKNSNFTKIKTQRLRDLGTLILYLDSFTPEIKPYILLNLFRSFYELDLKSFKILAEEYSKNQNKSFSKKAELNEIKKIFFDFPKFNEILVYFRNDFRNAIAHEGFLADKENFFISEENSFKKYDYSEINSQISQLFYLLSSLESYLCLKIENILKSNNVPLESLNQMISRFDNFNNLQLDYFNNLKNSKAMK